MPVLCNSRPRPVRLWPRDWHSSEHLADEQLARTEPWLAGDAFSLADVVVGLSAHRWLMAPIERPVLPAVLAYYERLSARPGFRLHRRTGMP